MSNLTGVFNKLFNINENIEDEKKSFVNRINQTIFRNVQSEHDYEKVFKMLCYWLGINAYDRINEENRYSYGYDVRIPTLRTLTNDDFLQTLKVLTLLYQYFNDEERYNYEEDLRNINGWVSTALSNSNFDLGIEWKVGMFYPKGARILDEKLIEDPLDWLNIFPEAKEDYKKALYCLLKKDYHGVVDNCYLAVEGLARKILNNKKTFDNNKEELLKKINFSQPWKSFLNKFTEYANEFKRHASENRNKINPQETEAFLYLTGLLVRVIIAKE